jgi:hypothetical protein
MEVSGEHHAPAVNRVNNLTGHALGPRDRQDFWRRDKFISSVGIRTPDRPGRSAVTILSELFRLPSNDYEFTFCFPGLKTKFE